MKTKFHFAIIITTFFAIQIIGQSRTTVSAINSDISDNLDLTAVSSIFGESQSLNDFERRLNDPEIQISNLDLNNDNRVDYLRVIESVENNTHVVIIQSIIGRDLYQDVATIEIEKDRQNKISIQIVGNAFIYGQNYIYEPIYYSTPKIYASFWVNYYRPYYSAWTWNFYPSYYIAWNPYPVYRYRQNVYGCVNYHNTYNYVTYRRCYRAPAIYTSYSCNSYERRHPEHAFYRRNSNYTNRHELNQRRYSNSSEYRGKVAYQREGSRENSYQRENSKHYKNNNNYNNSREYTQSRNNSPKEMNSQRDNNYRESKKQIITYQKDNSPRETNIQRTESQRDYSQNRVNNSRESYSQKDHSQNMTNRSRENNSQRAQSQRDFSQNRGNSSREKNTQRTEPQRGNDYASRNNNRRI